METPNKNLVELPANYSKMNKNQKLKLLWDNIEISQYPLEKLPTTQGNFRGIIKLIWKMLNVHRYSSKIFSHLADEIPSQHEKLVHRYGTVATVKYKTTGNHPFTGLFQEDNDCLLRASLAFSIVPGKSNYFLPGIAIKFLIDGQSSLNLTLLNSFDFQETEQHDFFSYTLANIIPTPKKLLPKILSALISYKISNYFQNKKISFLHLPLEPFAKIKSDGTTLTHLKAPYKIWLEPAIKLNPETSPDYRIKLSNISPGTLLYNVYGQESENSAKILMGNIVTTNKFIASYYGDKILFFQHALPINE